VHQTNGLSQTYNTPNGYPADPYAHYWVPNGQGQYNNGMAEHQDRIQDRNNPRSPHVTGYGSYAPSNAGSGGRHHYGRGPLSTSSYNSREHNSDNLGCNRGSSDFGGTQAPRYHNGSQNYYQQLPYRDENRFRSQPPSLSNSGTSGSNSRNDSFEQADNAHGSGAHQIDNVLKYKNFGSHHKSHSIHNSGRQQENDFRQSSSFAANERHHIYRKDAQNNDNPPKTPVRQQLNEASEPAREKTSTWLESINTTNEKNMQEIADRLRSPIQNQSTALNRVNGSDPFTTPVHRIRHSMNNPITPISTIRSGALSLYTNDGFSPQYKMLTKNGTCRPNIDEALLPVNIPFIEYCRTAISDESGVIKIRNVSYPKVFNFILTRLGDSL
jgi:hypothetical protein